MSKIDINVDAFFGVEKLAGRYTAAGFQELLEKSNKLCKGFNNIIKEIKLHEWGQKEETYRDYSPHDIVSTLFAPIISHKTSWYGIDQNQQFEEYWGHLDEVYAIDKFPYGIDYDCRSERVPLPLTVLYLKDKKGYCFNINAYYQVYNVGWATESWNNNRVAAIYAKLEYILISEWREVKDYAFDYHLLQSEDEIKSETLNVLGEYGSKWIRELEYARHQANLDIDERNRKAKADNPDRYWYDEERHVCEKVRYYVLFFHPELEMLFKCQYCFIENILFIPEGRRYYRNNSDFTTEYPAFKRICQNGKSPKEIFKIPLWLAKYYKDSNDIKKLDVARKLEKLRGVTPDGFIQMENLNLTTSQTNLLDEILRKTYDNRPIFSLETLCNFLQRIDNFQAIGIDEGLQLLKDYLSMCQQLNIEPNIDSDSLKREHDVAARTLRFQRDEEMVEAMRTSCTNTYNYTEEHFFARECLNYDDLIDEAKQQHNCLAGYASRIVQKTSLIYFIRDVECPEKSLISVELSPDGKNIRQKYLKYNREISNPEHHAFIRRWKEYINTIISQNNSELTDEE